jgi:hypothetical protein
MRTQYAAAASGNGPLFFYLRVKFDPAAFDLDRLAQPGK